MNGTIIDVVQISGKLSDVGGMSGNLSAVESMTGTLTLPTVIRPDYYDGAYEVTPTDTAVVLDTARLAMRNDVVINPIPSNYGLITWNGSTLTVS